MSGFGSYFSLGLQHIGDMGAYDHIVFLLALVARYGFRDWKKVLILVTAFTVGHSITLALAALSWIPVQASIIEFLIPVTIFCTAIYNLYQSSGSNEDHKVQYLISLVFGLVHGMGFSNFFRSLLGSQADLTGPLLAFNLGVEAGQLLIVLVALSLSFLVVDLLRALNRRDWTVFLSGAAAGISVILMQQTAFW